MTPKPQNVGFDDIQPIDTARLPVSFRIGRVFTRIREIRLRFKLRPTSLEGDFTHRETYEIDTGDRPDART